MKQRRTCATINSASEGHLPFTYRLCLARSKMQLLSALIMLAMAPAVVKPQTLTQEAESLYI